MNTISNKYQGRLCLNEAQLVLRAVLSTQQLCCFLATFQTTLVVLPDIFQDSSIIHCCKMASLIAAFMALSAVVFMFC